MGLVVKQEEAVSILRPVSAFVRWIIVKCQFENTKADHHTAQNRNNAIVWRAYLSSLIFLEEGALFHYLYNITKSLITALSAFYFVCRCLALQRQRPVYPFAFIAIVWERWVNTMALFAQQSFVRSCVAFSVLRLLTKLRQPRPYTPYASCPWRTIRNLLPLVLGNAF